ncbi:organic solute transporter Ostalpha-domain-containing protein, partial [Colletotrichum phormii]
PVVEQKLAGGIRVHGLLISLSAGATIVACCATAYLIFRHASNYTKPKEQKQIIRILLMVPVYSIACTLSIIFYKKQVYIGSVYEFYESLVIASFFLLLCQLLHPDLNTLRRVFNLVEPKKWLNPTRFFVKHVGRNKKGQTEDGLKWFNIIWFDVFQFCTVKFFGALTKCITEAADVYCKESKDPSHARIWVMVIEILSLVTAMMCLLQFYHQTSKEMSQHQPLLKFLAIKLVVFLFYLQTGVFEFLTGDGGPLKPTAYISHPSWAVGIPNTLLCFEMAAVAILHLWAYPYAIYKHPAAPTKTGYNASDEEGHGTDQSSTSRIIPVRSWEIWPQQPEATYAGQDTCGVWDAADGSSQSVSQASGVSARGFQWRALKDALNFVDIFRAVVGASRWLVVERRKAARARGAGAGGVQIQNENGIEYMERTRTDDLSEALNMVNSQTPRR